MQAEIIIHREYEGAQKREAAPDLENFLRARRQALVELAQVVEAYLGLGLGALVNAVDPARIYLSGEITGAWDQIEPTVRAGLRERALTAAAKATPIEVVPQEQYPRLRGAAALVALPAFAAPVVA